MGVWSNYLWRRSEQLKDESRALATARIDAEIDRMRREIVRAEDVIQPPPQQVVQEVPSLDEIRLRQQVTSESNLRQAILEHIALEWMLSQRAFKTLALKYGNELGKTYAQIIDEYKAEASAQLTDEALAECKNAIVVEKKVAKSSGINETNCGTKIKISIFK